MNKDCPRMSAQPPSNAEFQTCLIQQKNNPEPLNPSVTKTTLNNKKKHFKPKIKINKSIKRDEEGYFTLIKRKTCQHDFSILNAYVPSARSFITIKETLLKLKSHIENYTLLVRDLNTTFCTYVTVVYVA